MLPWVQTNYLDMNMLFQRDGASALTSKKAKKWLEYHLPFWPKKMCPSTHQMVTYWTSLFGSMLCPKPLPSIPQISTTSRTPLTSTGMPYLRTISAMGAMPSVAAWKPSLLPRGGG
uniref:Uncharacterized protein n=1 Tax=Lepeophtheirus salmonis TaxID=72036 RepID=A0A0K2UU95_LEPSM